MYATYVLLCTLLLVLHTYMKLFALVCSYSYLQTITPWIYTYLDSMCVAYSIFTYMLYALTTTGDPRRPPVRVLVLPHGLPQGHGAGLSYRDTGAC